MFSGKQSVRVPEETLAKMYASMTKVSLIITSGHKDTKAIIALPALLTLDNFRHSTCCESIQRCKNAHADMSRCDDQANFGH